MYVSQKQISPGNFASVLILLATWAHAIAFVAELRTIKILLLMP